MHSVLAASLATMCVCSVNAINDVVLTGVVNDDHWIRPIMQSKLNDYVDPSNVISLGPIYYHINLLGGSNRSISYISIYARAENGEHFYNVCGRLLLKKNLSLNEVLCLLGNNSLSNEHFGVDMNSLLYSCGRIH